MNKTRFTVLVFSMLAVISLVFAPLAITGCGSPTAKTTQVAGTVSTTVDAAMNAWGEYVRAGKATVDDRVKVRDAYMKYQAAMKTAETMAVTSLSATNGAPAYRIALDVASSASVDLLALVNSFTSKK